VTRTGPDRTPPPGTPRARRRSAATPHGEGASTERRASDAAEARSTPEGADPGPAPTPPAEPRTWPPAHTVELDPSIALELLRDGEIELVGRLVASSNNAMVGTVRQPEEPLVLAPCVYKPIAGERPLWDFPDGTLAAREVAAFALSEAGAWSIVPPTVLRDGPFGQGMVQLWIEPDASLDAVAMVVEGDERLRPVALFDVVANNADRKIGHLLPMADGHVFGVDHGICFHEEPKLRTVLWQWRGMSLTDVELATLRRLRVDLAGDLGRELRRLLEPGEVRAVRDRIDGLVHEGCFPHPDPDRPAIPWPPY
jgi:uncharacterized repeat protein (TIGR03843 family)